MSYRYHSSRSPPAPLSATILIQRIGAAFSVWPDTRGKSNNPRYEMADAALSAFSIFFTPSPSFFDSPVRMQKQQGKNNAASLFGVHEISSDNPIRNWLDPVPPETLFPLVATISDELYREGYLDRFRSINGPFLIPLDGTDFFSSEKISCPCCTQSKQKNGKTLNRPIAVTPVLVSPQQKNGGADPPICSTHRTVMTSKTASGRPPVAGLTRGARTMRHRASLIWATIYTAISRIVSACQLPRYLQARRSLTLVRMG